MGNSSSSRKSGGSGMTAEAKKLNAMRAAEARKIAEARRIAELRANVEAKKEEVKKPVVEPLDKNSQVTKFMDKLLAKPEKQWNKNILTKEGKDFEHFAKDFLPLESYGVKQGLITSFLSMKAPEILTGVINKADEIIANPYSSAMFKEHARQWKNYAQYYLENKLTAMQKKEYEKIK